MDEYEKRLLAEMKPGRFYTAKQLSSKLNISEKTVRQRIKQLSVLLSEHGGAISSTAGHGFQFLVLEPEIFSAWHASVHSDGGEALPTTARGRVAYIIERLLYEEDYVKLDDLCQTLFISRTTITSDMKQVKWVLLRHRLQLIQRPGYGICLEGGEFDRRSCMVHELIQKNYSGGVTATLTGETYPILEILSRAFNQTGLKTAEWMLENLIFYIYVALRRISSGHLVRLEEQERDDIRKTVGENVAQAVQFIALELEEYAGCAFNEDEQADLMIHIGGKSDSSTVLTSELQTQMDAYAERLVGDMLKAVHETHGLDFRKDSETVSSLKQHLISFDIRMKYNLSQTNPILGEIKEEYSVAYTIASTAGTVLARHYQKPVPEEELGFFAILFALAIQKQEQLWRKKNIVVVCLAGQASSRLFISRCRKAFVGYLDQLYECSAFALSDFDFVGRKIDFVFTTVPISWPLPVPVIQVSLLLSDAEISSCRQLLSGEDQSFLARYFRKELFCGRIHAQSKEEALSFLCQNAAEHYPLPEDFYASVCRREEMGQTDFGNLVAIPHPCRIVGTQKFVSVAVLDRPIWWGHNDVQVIFLIVLEQDDPEAERFYQAVSDFLSSESAVQALISSPTYEALLDILGHQT